MTGFLDGASNSAVDPFASVRREPLTVGPLTATTNQHGFVEIPGVPLDVPMSLRVHTDNERGTSQGKRNLQLNEQRPTELIRLPSSTPKQIPLDLAVRLPRLLLNSKLNDTHGLIVISGNGSQAERLQAWALNYDKTLEVGFYLPLVISPRTTVANRDSVEQFLEKLNWPTLRDDKLTLIALDAEGVELGRLEVPVDQFESSSKQVTEFIKAFAPARKDAQVKWEAALAEAKKTGRHVWVRNSQTRCAPCFTFSRWLYEQDAILQKDYVMLKIDNVRDFHGAEVSDSIGAAAHGVPYHAIYDADGKKLIDSVGPLGNIGDPSGFEGLKHARRMIQETVKRITNAEIDTLIESLENRNY